MTVHRSPSPGRRGHSSGPGTILTLLSTLIAGLLAVHPAPAQSHRLRFEPLGPAEGLSQVSILAVLQDRQGFLWFGTQDGLNRYDGYELKVYRYDPDDPSSLTGSWVIGLYEDRDGQIWVVTPQPGTLNRFDPATGRFERFVHAPEDPTTLAPNQVNPAALWDDGAGSLWVGTLGGGLLTLDKDTGRILRLPFESPELRSSEQPEPQLPAADNPPGERLPGRFVSTLAADRTGDLWIGMLDGGLARRLPPAADGGERFERFRHDPTDPSSLGGDGVASIYQDTAGTLWIGTRGSGLDRLDRGGARPRFHHFRHSEEGRPPSPSDFLATPSATLPAPIVEDPRGDLWLVTDAGVSRFDRETQRLVAYAHDADDPRSLSHGTVTALYADRRGLLWLGTQGGGINLYEPDRDGFRVVRHRGRDRYALASDLITTFFEDRSGLVWVGTTDGGLSKYSTHANRFTHYASNPLDPGGLADDMIRSLLEDRRGRLWVGTMNGGLHRFDAQREAVIARFGRYPETVPDPGRDLGSDDIRALLQDRRDQIWVGTFGGGLARLDPDGSRVQRRYTHRSGDPASISSDLVHHVFEDSRGVLWIGTDLGWNRFDPERGTFLRFRTDPSDPSSLPHDTVRVTYEDRDGTLWLGTLQGLARFHPETAEFTRYLHDFRDPNSLGNDTILDIHQGEDGALWLATYGGGLNRLDPETGRSTHYTTRDGLPNDCLYSVVPDREGRYWLSTNRGLVRFDPATGGSESYGFKDGLQGLEFNAGAFFRSPSGELFFGGVNGFNSFVPGELVINPYVPPVVLTGFWRFGTTEDVGRTVSGLDRITLSHRDRYVTFEFTALDFTQPERNRYAYMLEGFDPSWVAAGSRRRADYTNLPGGRYTFRVKASSADGVWNEEGASIRVVVVPPPWKRWWAYTFYGLGGLGMVSGYVRFKTVAHRRELEQERLAAEDRRKSEELESARRIQLALLPDRPPELPGLAISAAMRTATEVGGDFYDFFPQADGSLYVVTGDATGHGLSAGMMVAMAKSALKTLEVCPPHLALARLDDIIRAVHPERMQMALSVAHIAGGRVELASAGMPPAFIHRHTTGVVEEILLPALPLGSGVGGVYHQRELDLDPGDTLLLLSDGLPERRDGADRMLGYEAIPRCLTGCLASGDDTSLEDVLEALLDLGERWSCGRAADDDVTLVVIRRTPPPIH